MDSLGSLNLTSHRLQLAIQQLKLVKYLYLFNFYSYKKKKKKKAKLEALLEYFPPK